MDIVLINGSIVGSNTKIALDHTQQLLNEKYEDHTITLVDLADYNLPFSDGRNYFEYDEETARVLSKIMKADALVIGTPVFQASIPGTLKNLFDLLPVDALRDKTVSIIVTAGTPKHYLMVEQQLKPILSYMKANIVPTYVFIEEQDIMREEIVNDDIQFRLERLIEDTIDTHEALEKILEAKSLLYDF